MRSWIAGLGAFVAALVVTEVVMRPGMGDRIEVAAFLAATSAAAALVAWRFPAWAGRQRRLRLEVLGLALVAVLLVGGAVTAASGLMFISTHDLQLMWIVVGFGLVISLIVTRQVAAPLTEDLERIAETARIIGDGDFSARTDIGRNDEVGLAATAIDVMARRLESIERERIVESDARSRLLRSIGHDLRTPLAALRAAVEGLRDGVVDDPARYLKAMDADIAALTTLVDDLFLLTRIESGQIDVVPELLDLSDLADETLEALRPFAEEHGVELALETEGHVQAFGGAAELKRVIQNLVDNAIQHSPKSGRVVVRVGENGSARVEVSDQGPGFREEFVDHAFESFSRDDAARTRGSGGAGLGLAIAHGLVIAHGGSIWADPGPGGSVSFEIPRAKGPVSSRPTPRPQPGPSPATPGAGPRG